MLSPQKYLPCQRGVGRCATPPASLLFSLEYSLYQFWGATAFLCQGAEHSRDATVSAMTDVGSDREVSRSFSVLEGGGEEEAGLREC